MPHGVERYPKSLTRKDLDARSRRHRHRSLAGDRLRPCQDARRRGIPAHDLRAAAAEHQTKHIDLQVQVNIRAIILFYREAAELLRTAGAEHRSALVVNLASLAGKSGPPWLSVYGATKAAV